MVFWIIGLLDSSQIMLIEINEDIIDAAIKKESQINDALELLLMMAYCSRKGKHVVYVPCLRTNEHKIKELQVLLGVANARALNLFNGRASLAKRLLNNISVKAIVSYNDPTITTDSESCCRIIWLNPHIYNSFEPWVETHVLAENLNDSEFFSYLIKYFLKSQKLSGAQFNFYPLMGGGDTMSHVLNNEVRIRRHFCLVLADSDKLCPDGVSGSTATKVGEIMKCNPFNCGCYIMKYVREIENLIPQKIVAKLRKGKDHSIFDKDPSFFDMKCGLTFIDLYSDNVCDYWKDLLLQPTLFQERDSIKAKCQSKKEYDKEVKAKEPLLPGFGLNILALALNKSETQKKRLDSKNDLYSVTKGDLNSSQIKEWEAIGKEMFSWTCCLGAKN